MLGTVMHTVHVLLAGVWLGGVVFTTLVVSPALKAMKWEEAERVGVRSVIGRYYATMGSVNLALLLVFAVANGVLNGFGVWFYVEYALIALLFGLVVIHGAYFGRRLARLAFAERTVASDRDTVEIAGRRRALQRVSFRTSVLSLAVSAAIVVLAANVT